MASSARDENVYMAKLAEQAERYEEMVEFMEKVSGALSGTDELTVEERNLLSVAYKNVIGSCRASWHIISSIEQKEESSGNEDHVFLNPLVNGDYPEIVKKNAGNRIPTFTKVESKRVKGSFDFFGINHYSTLYVKDDSVSLDMDTRDAMADMAATYTYGRENEAFPDRFPVAPLGLQKLLNYVKEEYGNPAIYIHENGQLLPHDGILMDTPRIEYLHAYIGALLDALRNGSNTRGYFVWSFLDVFEVGDGYSSSFGMYYVDFDDKKLTRYPKLSAQWYARFLKEKNLTAIIHNSMVQVSFSSAR
ncbi:hypothetical protein LXL04_036420 [Taraxacum kok-saghyz]